MTEDYYEKMKKDYAINHAELEKSWQEQPIDKLFSDKFFEKDYESPKWEDFKKSILNCLENIEKA